MRFQKCSKAKPHYIEDLADRFRHAFRSWELLAQLDDAERTAKAKGLILTLHREGLASDGRLWWIAYDFFDRQRGALSDEERDQLIADLEQILLRFSDVSVPGTFDPHIVKHAAQHLIKHYTRLRKPDDVRRLYQTIARVTEHHAALGDAILASVLLQESLDFYKQAGLKEDAERIRILMQDKIGQVRLQMKPVVTEFKISQEDMDSFLASVVTDDIGRTFVRLAASGEMGHPHLARAGCMEGAGRQTTLAVPFTVVKAIYFSCAYLNKQCEICCAPVPPCPQAERRGSVPRECWRLSKK